MLQHKPTIATIQNIQVPTIPKDQNSAKTTKPSKKQSEQGFQNASSKRHSSKHLLQSKQKTDSFCFFSSKMKKIGTNCSLKYGLRNSSENTIEQNRAIEDKVAEKEQKRIAAIRFCSVLYSLYYSLYG